MNVYAYRHNSFKGSRPLNQCVSSRMTLMYTRRKLRPLSHMFPSKASCYTYQVHVN